MIKKDFKNRGFMMVEVIVVISIVVVTVLAAMSITQKSIYVSNQSLHTSEASFLLEEGAEAVRTLRDGSWSNITSLTSGTTYYPTFSSGAWSLSTTSSSVGIFTRTVTIANVNRDATTANIASVGVNDVGTKLVTVTVSWKEGSNTLTKTLSYYLMDIFS